MRAAASVALFALCASSAPKEAAPLGLCPIESGRLDGFMRAVCDGEQALAAGRVADAVALFQQAIGLPRLQATNELAWAGLAAAYCRARDLKRGREWAARFDEARRLWLGELSCGADGTAHAQPQPFVRDRMCIDALAADYDFVRTHPDAPVSHEIAARLQGVATRVQQECANLPTMAASSAAPTPSKAGKPAKRKAKKKVSGKRASPDRGR
jgi:hypothetical protein